MSRTQKLRLERWNGLPAVAQLEERCRSVVPAMFVGTQGYLLNFRLSSLSCCLDPWVTLSNEEKCSLCNLDLTAGLGNNLFCDVPVKMEFFFKNSDSERAELGILIG